MQELEKILEEIEKSAVYIESEYGDRDTFVSVEAVERIIRKHMSGKDINVPTNDGWIPVWERLPEEPKENPVFDDKPLELYLVDMGGSYPLRAFWNGKQFTDGWSILKVIAWRPLPEPYKPKQPETCKYTGGSCYWPIDQCGECPKNPERGERE